MKIQKSIVVLAFTLFALTGTIAANGSKPFSSVYYHHFNGRCSLPQQNNHSLVCQTNDYFVMDGSANECKALAILNKTMQEDLELTDSQSSQIWVLNQRYLVLRKNILSTADKTGRNTAVLACWDQWRLTLTENLDETQIAKFMQWQSQVDLLSETPY